MYFFKSLFTLRANQDEAQMEYAHRVVAPLYISTSFAPPGLTRFYTRSTMPSPVSTPFTTSGHLTCVPLFFFQTLSCLSAFAPQDPLTSLPHLFLQAISSLDPNCFSRTSHISTPFPPSGPLTSLRHLHHQTLYPIRVLLKVTNQPIDPVQVFVQFLHVSSQAWHLQVETG